MKDFFSWDSDFRKYFRLIGGMKIALTTYMTNTINQIRANMAHDRAGIHTDALSETAKYGYIPGLDGLRAIAVLVVIAAHFGVSNLIPGGFGVTLFFFISGFLITRLLIAEQGKSGTIALKNFYIRRLIRLFPALLFMVFGSTAIFALAGFGGPSKLEFLAAIGYFTNFFQVYSASTGAEMPYMSWTHLWSLAVEEHFYMLFPLVILAFGNTIDRLLKILLAILIIVPLWRLTAFTFFDFSTDTYNYMMTDARIDSIVWGCVFTIALHKAQSIDKFRAFIGLVPFGLALGALLFTFVFRDEMFRQVWRYSVQGVSLMVLFLNLYYLKLLKFSFSMMPFTCKKFCFGTPVN